MLLIDGLHNAHKLVKIQQLLSYKLLFEVFLCSSLLLFYFCLSYVFLKLFLAVYYFFTDGMKEFLDVFFELGLVVVKDDFSARVFSFSLRNKFFIFCSGKKNNKILVTFSRFGLHFFPDLRPLILFWNMPTSNIFIDFVLFLFNIWHLTDILTKSLTFFKSWSK